MPVADDDVPAAALGEMALMGRHDNRHPLALREFLPRGFGPADLSQGVDP